MREIIFDEGKKVVKSPWLRAEEAAAYCGLSRATFDRRAAAVELPHRGNTRTRVYNVSILDKWIEGQLDVPFYPPEKTEGS